MSNNENVTLETLANQVKELTEEFKKQVVPGLNRLKPLMEEVNKITDAVKKASEGVKDFTTIDWEISDVDTIDLEDNTIYITLEVHLHD